MKLSENCTHKCNEQREKSINEHARGCKDGLNERIQLSLFEL